MFYMEWDPIFQRGQRDFEIEILLSELKLHGFFNLKNLLLFLFF